MLKATECTMQATLTTFDRQAMPSNLLTVADWLTLARNWYRGANWENCAKRYAAQHGGAIVMRCDDTLVVFTREDNGKVRKSSFAPGTWAWAAD